MKAGAVAGAAYVLAVPVFSAFRLELVLVPMAAVGLALGARARWPRWPPTRRVGSDRLAERLDLSPRAALRDLGSDAPMSHGDVPAST